MRYGLRRSNRIPWVCSPGRIYPLGVRNPENANSSNRLALHQSHPCVRGGAPQERRGDNPSVRVNESALYPRELFRSREILQKPAYDRNHRSVFLLCKHPANGCLSFYISGANSRRIHCHTRSIAPRPQRYCSVTSRHLGNSALKSACISCTASPP